MDTRSVNRTPASELVYFADALINGKRFPPGCLTTSALVYYSFEQTGYAENVEIEQHLKECNLCREFLRYFHYDQGNHATIHQLIDHVLGNRCWNPMSAGAHRIIEAHLTPSEQYLTCNRCRRIVQNLEALPLADLFRLRNDDLIAWDRHRRLFDNFNRHEFAPSTLITMIAAGLTEADANFH